MITQIIVNAWGTPAGGIAPTIQFRIDGHVVSTVVVSSTSETAYDLSVDLDPTQSHDIQMTYANPGKVGGHMRTLYIDSVDVNGHIHHATDPDVTFDKGALDGIGVVAGREKITQAGTLEFTAPASDFASRSSPTGDMHTAPGSERGMWVWNTGDVIGTESKLQTFISTIKAAGVSDAYLYLRSADYASQDAHLEHALTELHNAGIKAWGLEGWRGYFADADGPSGLYAAADQLVAFNTRHATGAQFAGFVSDMEPQDGQGPTFPNHFHNGLADSQLSAAQAADREMLMEDWVRIQTTLDDKMHAAHLQYAATMPSWTDDYYGQPVNVTVNGVREGVMQAIMGHVDQYLAMTYNTDPTNAANRALGEVSYADTLGPNHPLVFAAVETNSGVGRGVSYGDDAVKDTRAAVLADMQAIHDQLASHPSFGGVNIHDWTGWWNLHP